MQRLRSPRCVGQRDWYPFAILFREFPVEREELIRRAMRWPDPLADQGCASTETIKGFITKLFEAKAGVFAYDGEWMFQLEWPG
jgi:hypothetical protein